MLRVEEGSRPAPSMTRVTARHAARIGHRRLVVIAFCGVLLVSLAVQPVRALFDSRDTDYVSAYSVAALMLAHGDRCIYCPADQLQTQRQVTGTVAGQLEKPNPYENAPLGAWLLEPLAGLPPTVGLAVFLCLCVAALSAATLVLFRSLRAVMSRRHAALILVASVASLPAGASVAIAGWDPLLLLPAALALALVRRHPGIAGALLGIVALKPQLVWLVVPLALVAANWWLLGGMLAAAGAWALTAIAVVGPEHLLDWPRLLLTVPYAETPATLGLPGLVAVLTSSSALGDGLAGVLLIVGATIAFRIRGGLRRDPAGLIALGITLSLVCSPHLWPADLLIAAVPLCALARTRAGTALALAVAGSGAWLVAALAGPIWLHLETAVLLFLAVSVCRQVAALAQPDRWGSALTRIGAPPPEPAPAA